MGNAIDRLLLGGAFVFGGLIHRRVGQVDERVDAVEDVVEDLAAHPQVPGMPLPTGYGLQVRGPAGEDILVPVCLPPGFELHSLVLKPSFLPQEQAPAPATASGPPPAAPPAPAEPGERLGEPIQLVYSEQAGFRTGGEGLVARPAEQPVRDASVL